MSDARTGVELYGRLGGTYTVAKMLRTEAVADVFVGLQSADQRDCEIKFIHHAVDASGLFVARFEAYAESIVAAQSANFVQLLDYGSVYLENGALTSFVVVEPIDGHYLTRYSEAGGAKPLGVRAVLQIGRNYRRSTASGPNCWSAYAPRFEAAAYCHHQCADG